MSIHNVWKSMKTQKELEKRDQEQNELKTKFKKRNITKKSDPLGSLQSSFCENDLDDMNGEEGNQIQHDDLMVQQSKKRAMDWVSNNIMNPDFLNSLKTGIDNGQNYHTHKFRDRVEKKELSKNPVIPRRYDTAKIRAIKAERDFHDGYLYKGPYNQRQIRKGLERERQRNKEIGPGMRYGIRTENERIYKVLRDNSGTDYAKKDVKMLHFPDWKEVDKSHWVDDVDFIVHNPKLSVASRKTAWKQIENRLPGQDDPYIEGLEKLGNDLSLRARDPSKEVKN